MKVQLTYNGETKICDVPAITQHLYDKKIYTKQDVVWGCKRAYALQLSVQLTDGYVSTRDIKCKII